MLAEVGRVPLLNVPMLFSVRIYTRSIRFYFPGDLNGVWSYLHFIFDYEANNEFCLNHDQKYIVGTFIFLWIWKELKSSVKSWCGTMHQKLPVTVNARSNQKIDWSSMNVSLLFASGKSYHIDWQDYSQLYGYTESPTQKLPYLHEKCVHSAESDEK